MPCSHCESLYGAHMQQVNGKRNMEGKDKDIKEFFADVGEANRYTIKEVIGKGSYGVVCSAVDNYTGEKVAIKKINNVFEHVSDATRILREIKLLRLLKHPGAGTLEQQHHILCIVWDACMSAPRWLPPGSAVTFPLSSQQQQHLWQQQQQHWCCTTLAYQCSCMCHAPVTELPVCSNSVAHSPEPWPDTLNTLGFQCVRSQLLHSCCPAVSRCVAAVPLCVSLGATPSAPLPARQTLWRSSTSCCRPARVSSRTSMWCLNSWRQTCTRWDGLVGQWALPQHFLSSTHPSSSCSFQGVQHGPLLPAAGSSAAVACVSCGP